MTDPRARIDNPDVEHETSDINVRGIVLTAAALAFVALLVHLMMWLLFDYFDAREAKREPRLFPLAEGVVRSAPEPRLQPNPAEEMKQLREDQRRQLYSFAWVDEASGVVRIPIDLAMKIVLEKGLPTRPDAAPPVQVRPSDASSGRPMEARWP